MAITTAKRWQRLGVEPGNERGGFDILVQSVAIRLDDYRDYPNHPRDWDQRHVRWCLANELAIVGLLGHVEYPHAFGDVVPYGRRSAQVAVEYFYGDWRDGYQFGVDEPISRQQCRKELDWIDVYREGLLWALVLDEKESLDRLAEWPDADLPVDDGAWNLTQGDIHYHILLARYLRGIPLAKSSDLTQPIRRSSRRRPKMLLDVLESIAAKDSAEFAQRIERYLKHYRQADFNPRQIMLVISIEGTILWHAARRAKLLLPELPVELMDLVVTRESLRSATDRNGN